MHLRTAAMQRDGLVLQRITESNSRHLYGTAAQVLAHHAGGGCNLRAGDLFGLRYHLIPALRR